MSQFARSPTASRQRHVRTIMPRPSMKNRNRAYVQDSSKSHCWWDLEHICLKRGNIRTLLGQFIMLLEFISRKLVVSFTEKYVRFGEIANNSQQGTLIALWKGLFHLNWQLIKISLPTSSDRYHTDFLRVSYAKVYTLHEL